MTTRMHVDTHTEHRILRLGRVLTASAMALPIAVVLMRGLASAYDFYGEEIDHDEIVEQLQEQEARSDAAERRLNRMQDQLNLRDPAWRAKRLKRCRELGQLETSRLCGKLHREQTWWEWLSASVDYSRSKAVRSKAVVSALPAGTAAASSPPTVPRAAGARVATAAAAASLPTATTSRSEGFVTIVRRDGTTVRLVYDVGSARLLRSE